MSSSVEIRVGQLWVDEDGYTRKVTKVRDNLVYFEVGRGHEFNTTIKGFLMLIKIHNARLCKRYIINRFFNEH